MPLPPLNINNVERIKVVRHRAPSCVQQSLWQPRQYLMSLHNYAWYRGRNYNMCISNCHFLIELGYSGLSRRLWNNYLFTAGDLLLPYVRAANFDTCTSNNDHTVFCGTASRIDCVRNVFEIVKRTSFHNTFSAVHMYVILFGNACTCIAMIWSARFQAAALSCVVSQVLRVSFRP